VTWADVALAAARGLHLAATLLLTGALVFCLLVAPFPLTRVLRPSLVLALLGGLAWLVLQSAELSDASNLAETFAAVPVAALHTRFGHVLLLRLAVLPVAVLVAGSGNSRGRLAVATMLGVVAVALEARLGHVAASGAPLLVASLSLHLLAASVWLGGLIPLWLALAGEHPGVTARRFSLVAVIAVATLAATALQQAAALIGGLPGMVGSEYGHTASVKLFLLLFVVSLAVVNRFVLTPALDAAPVAMRRLRASVVVETVLGLCVVLAAAQLASLPPGVHLQPDWPFAWRPSLDALADPGLRREVTGALGALVGAVLLLGLGIAVRRLLWPAIAAAAVIAVLAVPHLEPLLVPAYPTSFYTSLTDFDGYGIAHGAQLFAQHCVSCHGADGRGAGALAHGLDIPPADLTAEHLWAHTDGEMFWYLTHGMDSPRGGLSMPGFGSYAIVTGLTPATLAGTVFLVDPAGWLRTRIRPSDPPPDFFELARSIIANPLAAPAGIGHRH
jgi:putative copper export protein/mono/diheme cytochrome c family protein